MLFLSFCFSIGGEVQRHAVGLLKGDAPSLYDTVYAGSISVWPSLWVWLSNATFPPYLLGAAVVAHFALLRRRLVDVMVTAGFVSALVLTILDLTSVLLGSAAAADLAASVVANLVGGFLAAALLGVALTVYKRLSEVFPGGGTRRDIGAATAVVAFGVTLSALSYFMLTFLFQPVNAKVVAVLQQPLHGILGTGDGMKQVTFTPPTVAKGSLALTDPDGPMQLTWQSQTSDRAYDVDTRFVAGCFSPDLAKLDAGNAAQTWKDVKRLSVSVGKGDAWLKALPVDGARYAFAANYPSAFWLKSERPNEITSTFYVTERAQLSATSPGGFQILVAASLVMPKGESAAEVTERQVRVTVGGKPVTLSFKYKPANLPAKRFVQCTRIDGTAAKSGNRIVLESPVPQAGLLITVRQRASSKLGQYQADASKLSVVRPTGWLSFAGFADDDASDAESGSTNMLAFTSRPLVLEVDEKSVEPSDFDQYFFAGNLSISPMTGGKVRVSGTANTITRNDVRLSPTKWERLSGEAKLALLGALMVFLGGFVRLYWWPTVKASGTQDIRRWV